MAEVTSLRTQYTRTYALGNGTDEQVVGSVPLNYRASDGSWQPVDDSFVADAASGFAWRNQADSYSAELPTSLAAGPVRVDVGGQWVAFQLENAGSTAGVVSGDSITYPDALPGVSVTYTATPTGLQESLSLASAAAASSFTFDVSSSAGLSQAGSVSSGVTFSAAGSVVASFSPPWVMDAATRSKLTSPLTSSLSAIGGTPAGQRLTVGVASSWLHASGRAFPVTVDPSVVTIQPHDYGVCTLSSTDTDNTTTRCGDPYARIGYNSTATRRIIAKFAVAANVPQSAMILDADMQLYEQSDPDGATSMNLDTYPNSQQYNATDCNWNYADLTGSGTPWNSGHHGGDVEQDSIYQTPAGNNLGHWDHFYIGSLAQSWNQYGGQVHAGVVLERDGNATGLIQYANENAASNQPVLSLVYTGDTGKNGISTYLDQPLSDKTTLSIDPADGNALITTKDLSVNGIGAGSTLSFSHAYNSDDGWIASQAGVSAGELGAGWTADNSNDSTASLYNYNEGGPAVLVMPGSQVDVFTRGSYSGSWKSPQGVDADLTVNGSTIKLVDHHSGLTYKWTDNGNDSTTGYLTSITTPAGDTIGFSGMGGSGASTGTITDTHGTQFTETHDANGRLQQINDSASGLHAGFTVNNATGELTDYYDPELQQGNPHGDGAHLQYQYSGGQLSSITDVSTGRTMSFTYYPADPLYGGYLKSVTLTGDDDCNTTTPASNVTTYTYTRNLDSHVPQNTGGDTIVGETTVTSTNPNNSSDTTVTDYYWDEQQRVVGSWTATKGTSTQTYDDSGGANTGELAKYIDGLSNATQITWNTDDTVHSVTEPQETGASGGASSTITSYSDTDPSASDYGGPQALPTQVQDSAGNTVTYHVATTGETSGGQDLITKVSEPVDGTTATQVITYNSDGTVKTVTNADAGDNPTTYSYINGNPTQIQPPGPVSPTVYTYTADNQVHTMKTGDNHTTTYTYDGDGRVMQAAFDDGTSISYTYDADGNLIQRTDRDALVTKISYDGENRPTSQTYRGENQSFCYDFASNLTSLTTGGGTVTYDYYKHALLEDVTEPGGGSCSSYWAGQGSAPGTIPATTRCIAFGYDSAGRRQWTGFPGGVLQYINRGGSGGGDKIQEIKVTKNGGSTYEDTTYNYNTGGKPTDYLATATDQRNGVLSPITTSYSYDGMDRLTGVTNLENGTGANPPTVNETINYDLEGNIASLQLGGTTTQYNIGGDDQLACTYTSSSNTSCSSAPSPTTYNYDNAGNLTGDSSGFSASYDAADVTTSINSLSGGTACAFTYADYGQSTRASETGCTDPTTYTESILGPASATTVGTTNTRTDYTYTPDGQLLSERTGPTIGYNAATTTNDYYSMTDTQHSVLGLTDTNGNIAEQYAYDPYGQVLAHSGSLGYAGNTRLWLGAEYDSQTSLYHLGARYYAASVGRFLTPDPKGQLLDLTRVTPYQYGGGDSANATDLSGQDYCLQSPYSYASTCNNPSITGVGPCPALYGLGAGLTGVSLGAMLIPGLGEGWNLGLATAATFTAGAGDLVLSAHEHCSDFIGDVIGG